MSSSVVAIMNMKGGVGKTTLAVNLAWVLSELRGLRVLLVDLDPQFNATQYMMLYKEYKEHLAKRGTVVDIFYRPRQPLGPGTPRRRADPPSYYISNQFREKSGGSLDLIPSQLELFAVIKNPGDAQKKLPEFLSLIEDNYDLILIDCGPTETILTIAAFMASDYVLVPVTPDPFAIIGFPLMETAIEDFKGEYSDPKNIALMGTIFTNVEEDATTEPARQEIRGKATYTFKNEMRYTRYYRHSVKNKTPLYRTTGCKTHFKKELENISDEFLERLEDLNA